jgi:hypothetical protein
VAQELINRQSGGLSRFDNVLLDGAASGKSGDELSRLVGGTLNPAQAILHVQSLLRDRDIWTMVERKALMLHQLYDLADSIKKQFKQSGDTAEATLLLKTLTQVSTLLEKQSTITDDELNRVNQQQAKMILNLVVAGFDRAKAILAQTYPDLPFLEIEESFQEGLASVTYDND